MFPKINYHPVIILDHWTDSMDGTKMYAHSFVSVQSAIVCSLKQIEKELNQSIGKSYSIWCEFWCPNEFCTDIVDPIWLNKHSQTWLAQCSENFITSDVNNFISVRCINIIMRIIPNAGVCCVRCMICWWGAPASLHYQQAIPYGSCLLTLCGGTSQLKI